MKIDTRYVFSFYKKYYKNTEDISRRVFSDISNMYVKFLISKVIEGKEVYLPQNCGRLSIVGTKEKVKIDKEGNITGLSPNWRKTKELWDISEEARKNKKLVYNTNEHSEGIRYRFKWHKRNVNAYYKSLFSLRVAKPNKDFFRKNVKNKKSRYKYEE